MGQGVEGADAERVVELEGRVVPDPETLGHRRDRNDRLCRRPFVGIAVNDELDRPIVGELSRQEVVSGSGDDFVVRVTRITSFSFSPVVGLTMSSSINGSSS